MKQYDRVMQLYGHVGVTELQRHRRQFVKVTIFCFINEYNRFDMYKKYNIYLPFLSHVNLAE